MHHQIKDDEQCGLDRNWNVQQSQYFHYIFGTFGSQKRPWELFLSIFDRLDEPACNHILPQHTDPKLQLIVHGLEHSCKNVRTRGRCPCYLQACCASFLLMYTQVLFFAFCCRNWHLWWMNRHPLSLGKGGCDACGCDILLVIRSQFVFFLRGVYEGAVGEAE